MIRFGDYRVSRRNRSISVLGMRMWRRARDGRINPRKIRRRTLFSQMPSIAAVSFSEYARRCGMSSDPYAPLTFIVHPPASGLTSRLNRGFNFPVAERRPNRTRIQIGTDDGRSEPHSLRHGLAVLVAEVAVGLHSQDAAVLVSQPTRYRWDIHACLNAASRK